MPPKDTTSLYDPPSNKVFPGDPVGRQALQLALDAMYRDTRVMNPAVLSEVRLNSQTRRTQNGFRYMSSALWRVCRALSPGLSNVVSNLSGPTRHDAGGRETYSTAVACEIFNQVVDLRFHAVLTKAQLVVDEAQHTIEGLLGPKTHYLENGTFIELVESALQDCCGAEFAGATLAGRRLFARYLRPELIKTPAGNYRAGYAVCATESGDDAIRAYLLYRNEETGDSCLEVPTGGFYRQRRTGQKFMEQLKRLLVKLAMATPRDFNLDIQRLRDRPLFPNADPATVASTLTRWRRLLKLAGMSADLAKDVTKAVVQEEQDPFALAMPSVTQLKQLTERDLFVAAMAVGQNRSQRSRESTERAAFSVFFKDSE